MWLHPSSRAIRLIPHPSAFSRSIAATSSGVRISSPHGTSAREATWFSLDPISTSSLPPARGPVPYVVRGPVLHVARQGGSRDGARYDPTTRGCGHAFDISRGV